MWRGAARIARVAAPSAAFVTLRANTGSHSSAGQV